MRRGRTRGPPLRTLFCRALVIASPDADLPTDFTARILDGVDVGVAIACQDIADHITKMLVRKPLARRRLVRLVRISLANVLSRKRAADRVGG